MRKAAFFALALFATPLAAAELTGDAYLGHDMTEVTASLKEMGYEVRKAEMEDGKIEVYFVKDGEMGEVYVDPESGKVAKLELK